MFKFIKRNKTQEDVIYNKILLLSRNNLFYTKLGLKDTFQNRINLIFLHVSFIFIKIKRDNKKIYKDFYQKIFDLIFKKIEINLREIGYGDTVVNKNMKFLVKTFYSVLLNCELYKSQSSEEKTIYFHKYLDIKDVAKNANSTQLLVYFDRYETFCLDLSSESVLKGEINFNFN